MIIISLLLWILFARITLSQGNGVSCSQLNALFPNATELQQQCEANDFCAFADFQNEGGISVCYARCVQRIDACFILDVSDSINEADFETMQVFVNLLASLLFAISQDGSQQLPDGVDEQPVQISVLRFAEDTEISIDRRRLEDFADLGVFQNDVNALDLENPDLGTNTFTLYGVGNCTEIFQQSMNESDFFQCSDLPVPDPLCVDPFQLIFLITDGEPTGPTITVGGLGEFVIQPAAVWGPTIEDLGIIVFVAILTEAEISVPNLQNLADLNNPNNQNRLQTIITADFDLDDILSNSLGETITNLVNVCEPPTPNPTFSPTRSPTKSPTESPTELPTESPTLIQLILKI